MSPYEVKRRHPDLGDALDDVKLHHGDVELWRYNVRESADRRAEAVRDALSKGATLRELAALMSLTPEAVRRMATREG